MPAPETALHPQISPHKQWHHPKLITPSPKGALGTVDRTLGPLGQHFFHEIVDYHLIHHLFPKIPFYHAEEATRAILPIIGSKYIEAKDESFLWSLWVTFRGCNFVAERKGEVGNGKLWWVLKKE